MSTNYYTKKTWTPGDKLTAEQMNTLSAAVEQTTKKTIQSSTIDDSGHLMFTFSDGDTMDCGLVKGDSDSGSSVTVDSALSETSTNPVQNKVVTAELEKQVEFNETQTIHIGDAVALSYTGASCGTGWSYDSTTGTYKHTGDAGTLEFALPGDTGDLIFAKFNHNEFVGEDSVNVAYGDDVFLPIYDGTASVEIVLKKGTADTVFRINALNKIAVNISNLQVYKVLNEGGAIKEVRALNVSHDQNMTDSQTGFWNIALGPTALNSTVNGSRNIAVGMGSLEDLESGNRNVALGTFALAHATNADRNIFIGADSGLYLEKADDCISIGKAALSQGVKRDGDIAIGAGALYGSGDAKNSDASKGNVGIGKNSGYYCYGKSNVFVGSNAGYNTSSGNMNVCIGNEAGRNLTDGWGNTAIGSNAYNVGNYSRSIAIGYNAVPTKSFQAVIGSDALVNETVLNGDIVIKGNAIKRMPSVKLEYNYTDSSNKSHSGETVLLKTEDIAKGNNVAIGNEALKAYALSDSDQGTNVAIGNQAGQDMTGLANVIIGRNAGLCRTGTNNNVMIGSNAGKQLSSDKTKTQGSELTLIGAGTSTAEVGFSKSIAIGWNSKVTKSNQAVIGTEQLVETVLHGDLIVVGTDGVKRKLSCDSDGSVRWTTVS